jgi:hypothetical protein
VDIATKKMRPLWTTMPSMMDHALSNLPASISARFDTISGNDTDSWRN